MNKLMLFRFLLVLGLFLSGQEGHGQTGAPVWELVLADQSRAWVTTAPQAGAHAYAWLPSHLRIARQEGGEPQFSFLTWEEKPGDPIQGAILHFLVEWGLTDSQETEVLALLRTRVDSLAQLTGPLLPEAVLEQASYHFSSTKKSELVLLFQRGLTQAGQVPVTPGAKWAGSFRFKENEAVEMQKALADPSVLSSLRFAFHFSLPGISDRWSISAPLQELFYPKK